MKVTEAIEKAKAAYAAHPDWVTGAVGFVAGLLVCWAI